MIHVQGLTKIYGQHTALAGVALQIAEGEIFGLVGTNGAGRTTLLHILATLVRATAGQVTIAGMDVRRRPFDVRRCIGYVAESPAFFAGLTVREYLEVVAALRALQARRKAAAIAAALARYPADPARPLATLSQGQRQQLALATALLHEPVVLLLDEPMTHLDPMACQRMRAVLQELQSKGTTIVLACNTAAVLQGLCHRIGFMHQGRLLEVRQTAGAALDLVEALQAVLTTHTDRGLG
jgi:ABC-2 type transport system ATP-binding protein